MLSERDRLTIARILKINHAGEYAAIRIYKAQIFAARTFAPDIVPKLTSLLEHERQHLRRFSEYMPSRDARPCRTMWLWSLGGALLGFATAMFGRNGIWLCTHAVEDTVHKHLADQIGFLIRRDADLLETIKDIQSEEEGHIRMASQELNQPGRILAPLTWIVAISTGLVIWLSTWGDSTRLARQLNTGANT